MTLRAVRPFAGSHRLAVVTYHRVTSPDYPARSMAPGLASATESDFRVQLQDLNRRFTVIGAEDLADLRDGVSRRNDKPLVMVTFDDAYSDFADVAWPIIQRVGVPVTMFVASALPDGGIPYWWDRLAFAITNTSARELSWASRRWPLATPAQRGAAYRIVHDELQLLRTDDAIQRVDDLEVALDAGKGPVELLGWDDLRRLARDGLAIGGHSHAHHRLDRMHGYELKRDLATCRSVLADQLGTSPRVFAYPTGYNDDRVVSAVAEAGFDIGFTTDRGVCDLRRPDWLRVPRVNVGLNANAPIISLQILMLRRRAGAAGDLTDPATNDDTPPANMEELPDAPD